MPPRPTVAIALLVALVALGGGAGPSAADEALVAEAKAAFVGVVEQVDATRRDDRATPDDKRARIAALLEQWLDLSFMTRAALGENAEKFSPDELAAFSGEFGRYVVGVYVRRIARAEGDFEVLDASWREKSRSVMVRTRGGRPLAGRTPDFIRGKPGTAEVDYRLRKHQGAWRILTIVIDGADTVRLFQGQFEAALASATPEQVVARLREHNAEIEAKNPFAK